MPVIRVTGYDPGDYLHPDQKVEVIDESGGRRYEIYIRSNAAAPAAEGELNIFLPLHMLKEIQTNKEYCVISLSHPPTDAERRRRVAAMSGITLPDRRSAPATKKPVSKKRSK